MDARSKIKRIFSVGNNSLLLYYDQLFYILIVVRNAFYSFEKFLLCCFSFWSSLNFRLQLEHCSFLERAICHWQGDSNVLSQKHEMKPVALLTVKRRAWNSWHFPLNKVILILGCTIESSWIFKIKQTNKKTRFHLGQKNLSVWKAPGHEVLMCSQGWELWCH